MLQLLILLLVVIGGVQDGPVAQPESEPPYSARQQFRGKIRDLGQNIRQWIQDRRERQQDINDDTSDDDDGQQTDGERKRRRKGWLADWWKGVQERWADRPRLLDGSFIRNLKWVFLLLIVLAVLYVAWPLVHSLGQLTRIGKPK